MNREKKLLNNILIFAAGNMGSKLIQFVLIPFYTGILNPSEYGTVDMLQTISMLLIPIFSLTISESVFRYGMDNETDKKSVFTSGLFVTICGGVLLSVLTILVQGFLQNFFGKLIYIWLMISYSICNMLRTVTSQFLRAIGKVKIFTVDNVVQTASIVGMNLVLLLEFDMGIEGYMLGYILGNLFSLIFGFCAGKLWKYISIDGVNKAILKTMLGFSVPLILNTICWWISSSTDKLMLVGFVGTFANGLYSVAHKIPSIITIVVGVFIQAWQISANEEFNKKDTSEFYSQILEALTMFSFVISSGLMLFSKLEIKIITNNVYYNAWSAMIALIVGMAFFSFAQFLGTIYTANKKTTMAMLTNLLGAIVNVIFNYILIPKWGAVGAAIATSFSYLVLWLVRIATTQKIVKLKYRKKRLIGCSVVLVIQAYVQVSEIRGDWLVATLCLVMIMLFNFDILKSFQKKVLMFVRKK